MKLNDLIEGEYFNHYIKTGNICMLSEGRPGTDNHFSLHEGILRLNLDKPTYEKAGLTGKPVASPGRKHVRARYVVELNLRLPSMVRGRPLFNRMVYAFDNALNQSITWLFYDVDGHGISTKEDNALKQHAPFIRMAAAQIDELRGLRCPDLPASFSETGDESAELLEWLHLAMLDSPRIRDGDDIDRSLCRYSVPALVEGRTIKSAHRNGNQESTSQLPLDTDKAETIRTTDLVRLRWHGFLPAQFVGIVFSQMSKLLDKDEWFALRAEGFEDNTHTTLKRGQEAFVWECV